MRNSQWSAWTKSQCKCWPKVRNSAIPRANFAAGSQRRQIKSKSRNRLSIWTANARFSTDSYHVREDPPGGNSGACLRTGEGQRGSTGHGQPEFQRDRSGRAGIWLAGLSKELIEETYRPQPCTTGDDPEDGGGEKAAVAAGDIERSPCLP